MRLFLALVLAAATATPALADTIISGGNLINQTWTAANSPYVVQGDITVPAGSTLTIEAGTLVRFAESDAQAGGVAPNRVEIVVVGKLIVAGTAAQPVQMVGASASAGSWYGIVVSPAATGAVLDLTQLLMVAPMVGIYHRSTTATVSTAAVTMNSVSTAGVRVEAGAPTYNGISTSGGLYGFDVIGAGSVTFTNCLARGTTNTGARFSATTSGRTMSLLNCTLDDNGTYGVFSSSAGGSVTIRDSIVTSSFWGIYRNDSSAYSVTYSNVWGNNTNFISVPSTGTGCISANPLYVSTTNLRLTSNSPSRFGAMGGGDMGALPYTTDATPGWYGVLWSPVTFTAGTPYAIGGDLSVGPGVTVTIQPGAVLTFAASDIMQSGVDPARGELIVRGKLVANGTTAQPTQLLGTSAGSWFGIVVDPNAGAGAMELSHATLASPLVGIFHRSATATVSTSDVTISSVGTAGLRVEAGAPTYDGIATSGGLYGFEVLASGSLTLTNCVARTTTNTGARFAATTSGRSLSLVNCTLDDNGTYGVFSSGAAGSVSIKNSIITNSFWGIYRNDSSTYSVTYSNIWGNSTNLTGGPTAGTGCISQNPQYVSTTNLQLQGSSVCIDAGTATGAPMNDQRGVTRPLDGDGINGTAYDMGAFEYVLTPVCGNGAVEPGEMCDSGAQNGQYGACNTTCTGLGPRCGDGMLNGPETCDDGNTSNTDACLNTCVVATCGDGFMRAGVEQCDDSNTSDSDECVGTTCQLARCGDGFVRVGMEQCDDGNTSNNDACLADCTPAACGDGYTNSPSEECDDGNTIETDACLATCVAASCGDGVVRAGVEECDDSNTIATDGCTATCQLAVCGDGVTQAGVEECDDGNASDDDACSTQCTVVEGGQPVNPGGPDGDESGGCCNTGSAPGGLPALIALVGLGLGRRRKRAH